MLAKTHVDVTLPSINCYGLYLYLFIFVVVSPPIYHTHLINNETILRNPNRIIRAPTRQYTMPTMSGAFNDYFPAFDHPCYDMPSSSSNDWSMSRNDMTTDYSDLTTDSTFTIPQTFWDQQINETYIGESTPPKELTTVGSSPTTSPPALSESISLSTLNPEMPSLDFMANACEGFWAPQESTSPASTPSSPDMEAPPRRPAKRRSIHKVRQDHCVVEQKYRSGLKDAIQMLQGTVPRLQSNPKKVGVLLAAASHIKELEEECERLNAKNRWLMTHVSPDAFMLSMAA